MKEATGELNMTVITVIAIAAVAGLFYAFIWPMIQNGLNASTRCANAVSCGACTDGMRTCHWYEEDGVLSDDTVQCECTE